MDFKDRLLLKLLKHIDIKLGTVQDNVVIINENDPYFTDEDQAFLFDAIIRLDNEFGAITLPDLGHRSAYELTVDQKEIVALIDKLTKEEDQTNQIYIYGDLKINTAKALLTYKGITIPINPAKRPIKFLILLIKNKGQVIHHKDLARIFDFKGYDPSPTLTDQDFGFDSRNLKRDLKDELIELGEENAINIRGMIKPVPKQGYILR